MSYHFNAASPTSSLAAGSISFEMCRYSVRTWLTPPA